MDAKLMENLSMNSLINLNKRLYLQMLALAIIGYFAASRVIQDIYYRGKFSDYIADAFAGHVPRPEPLEIPFYFAGFLVIPVLAAVLCWFYEKNILKYVLAGVFLVALVKIFPLLSRLDLPDFEIYGIYLKTKGAGQALYLLFTKRIFVLRAAMAAAVIFYFLVRYFWKPAWAQSAFRFDSSKLRPKLEPAILIFIGLLLFHPNLPYDEGHYNFMIGTVHDMISGKPLLYETSNQYGILNMYFLHAIFSLAGRVSYAGFSLVIFFCYYAYYLALYFFIKTWLKSNLFALTGLGIIVAVTYFLQVSPTLTAFHFPAMSPFRLGMYVPVLFLLHRYFTTRSSKMREAAIMLSAAAVFWNFDTGASLAIAVYLTLGAAAWFEKQGLQEKLKWLVLLFGKFVLYGLSVFGLLNLLNYWRFGAVPDWIGNLERSLLHARGLAQIPLSLFGFFEVFVFVYLSTMLYFLYQKKQGRQIDPILFFLAVYGAFSFTYYIGVSAWNVFYQVSVPLILIALYFSYHYLETKLVASIFAALLFFAAFVWAAKIPVELAHRDYRDFGQDHYYDNRDPGLRADAKILRENYAALPRYPLMHANGTKLLIYAGRANWLPIYDFYQANARKTMRPLISMVKSEKPEYIFIGTETDEEIEYFTAAILADYELRESLNTLDVYQRKN